MILFDLSYFLHRIIFPNKDAVISNPDFFAHLMMNQIVQYLKKFGASKENKMVLCLDMKKTWRHQYYIDNKPKTADYDNQTYKGKRVKDPDIPWERIYEITDDIAEFLKNYSDLYVMKVVDCEADDIIATLAKKYSNEETVWVLSPDKDFVQLQDHGKVAVYDPLKNAFKPDQNIEIYKKIHNIIGDTSDNILAIKPRTKEKTAIKLLKDLDDLLLTNPEMREKYEFNRNLIDLDCIPEDIKNSIYEEFDKQEFCYNAGQMMKLCMKYKLSEHLENIRWFNLPNNKVSTALNQHFITLKRNEENRAISILDDW